MQCITNSMKIVAPFSLYSHVLFCFVFFQNIEIHKIKALGFILEFLFLIFLKKSGVPIVAQWLRNPTRNHEIVGLVPALAQWVDDPALP